MNIQENPTIVPSHAQMYEWTFQNSEDNSYVDIKIPLPDKIDPTKIQAKVYNNNSDIKVWFEEEIPIIWGHLFSTISSLSIDFKEKFSIIHLFKSKSEKWPIICNDVFGGEDKANSSDILQCDPQTLFILYHFFSNDKDNKQYAYVLLDTTLSYRFLPAIRFAGIMFSTIPSQFDLALEIFLIGINTYHDTLCLLNAGAMILSSQKASDLTGSEKEDYIKQGEAFLLEAGQQGEYKSYLILGDYFSPFSGDSSWKKLINYKKAVNYYQMVLKNEQNNFRALNALSKLVFYGSAEDNIMENEKEAIILFKKAKEAIKLANPNELQYFELFDPTKVKKSSPLKFLGPLLVTAAFIGGIIYFKKRKDD